VAGSVDHAIDPVKYGLQPSSGSKIDTRTPASRGHRRTVSLEPPNDLSAERAAATGDQDPHLVRIVIRVLHILPRRSPWRSPVEERR
jgi:hypothetical protein